MNKIHKMEVAMDKVEAVAYKKKREVRKAIRSWKAKVFAVLLGILLAGVMVFFFFYNVSKWYDKNKVTFQTPVEIRQAIIIKDREAVVASKVVKHITLNATDAYLPIINELYRKVRYIESGAGMSTNDTGTHAYCQRIGQVNEIGYLVDGNKHFCFADYGEQFLTFKRWFEKRLPKMATDEALCLWNTGLQQPMCNYSMKYHTL